MKPIEEFQIEQLSHQIGQWYLSEGLSVPSQNSLENMAESWAHTLISIKPSHIVHCFFYAKRDGGRPSASHILKVYAKHKDAIEYNEIQQDPELKKQLHSKSTIQSEWEENHYNTIRDNWIKWVNEGVILWETLAEIGITKEILNKKFESFHNFKTYKPLNFTIMDVDF